jgi:hydroxymethylbilane synthase
MLYAVGQGALGIECRAGDARVLELLACLEHYPTRLRCSAERAFMRKLEGGCSVPLGVCTHLGQGGSGGHVDLDMRVSVTSLDGSRHLAARQSIPLALPLGVEVGGATDAKAGSRIREAEGMGEALALALVEQGALDLLADIRRQ